MALDNSTTTDLPPLPLRQRAVVLAWYPFLLPVPLFSLAAEPLHAAGQALLAVAIGALGVGAVLTAVPRHPATLSRGMLFLMVVLVMVGSNQGAGWEAGWAMLAVTAPVALRGIPVLVTIVVAAGGIALSVLSSTGLSPALAYSVAGVLVAGGATAALLRLFEAHAELRRTKAQLAWVAIADERERLSRDLHDLLGHTLSVMVVKAQAVRRTASSNPDQAIEHAADIESVGRRALVDVRAAVDALRSPHLAEELDGAIRALEAAGIRALVTGDPVEVPAAAGQTLAWVVREGATNVLRHSGAATCVFEVAAEPGEYRLSVRDDGVGGPGPLARTTRIGGLDGLRRRLAEVGGSLDIVTGTEGFRLDARVPTP